MNTKPYALTEEEIKEIAALEDVRQMWGAQDEHDFIENTFPSIYAVKFDFISGGPGYVGDVFVLLGDNVDEPLILVRNRDKLLTIANK